MEKLAKFKALGLSDSTLEALKKKGFEEPTPIQEKVIPLFLKGESDIIGQAQTGTGKTTAFGAPIIEKIPEKSGHVQAIILTPTRELAIQVSEELNSIKGNKKLYIVPIYGGQSMNQQLRILKSGVDIVVGTPGRIIDHLGRKSLNLGNIKYFVLDEADEMLNMGFIDDIKEILKATGPDKRMLFFSATMPKPILGIVKKYMQNYEHVTVEKEDLATKLTEQIYFEVKENDKFEALSRIIDIEDEFYGLVFCRTKTDTGQLAQKLSDRGYAADALHGDLSQQEREKILNKFRKQKINILVATDVAARGIDIMDLTHVINYSLPQDPESYVHRIGRTGRAGKQGTAITFVTSTEFRRLTYIKKTSKSEMKKGRIPEIKDVIKAKRARVKDELEETIKTEEYGDCLEMSERLLEEYPAEKILAALLKYTFKEKFDESMYTEISNTSSYVDRKGKTRLFIAMGKSDGMSPEKLSYFIQEELGDSELKVRDAEIFPHFSFVTLPFAQAEALLEIFKNKRRGRKPFVELAQKSKGRSQKGSNKGYSNDRPRNPSRPRNTKK
ncbi:Cold-shock DEAD-box protein A [Methanosarcina siciliae T4/M]|uniref:RNA helicase n=2 Tax=Methanosarcina siciliae TaxID=38027 RepID=A0A0E3PHE3_9EURY|nr:DEAD/DEAH box helicase [Methanosarcina siciliae]AKB30019.1 Cold-shock DEAD-box protein A [Methanosarcina siciliae T4/M]AKB33919.1 Cold-shock DEAD-box protein A [Methanosarcina siciliae HI350]